MPCIVQLYDICKCPLWGWGCISQFVIAYNQFNIQAVTEYTYIHIYIYIVWVCASMCVGVCVCVFHFHQSLDHTGIGYTAWHQNKLDWRRSSHNKPVSYEHKYGQKPHT